MTSVNTNYVYDARDRLTTLTHQTGAGTALASYAYGYDADDRLASETNAEGTRTYSYDRADQLTAAGAATYSYDEAGNRTMAGYTTDDANRVVASPGFTYTYDDEGNLASRTETATGEVTTYAYDHRDRMTGAIRKDSGGSVLMRATYTYDALGRRIGTLVDRDGDGTTYSPERTWTAYDGDHAYADFDASGAVQMRYLHGPAVDMLLARTDEAAVTSWYLTDRLGTVRDVANTAGTVIYHAAFDEFGNRTAESGAGGDRWGYTGRELDRETGLQYNRARYYDAAIGRWTQEDPIAFEGGDANLYRYVGNRTTGFTDPDGLQSSPLSRPTDPNAIDSDQFNAIVCPALKGHIPINTPVNQIPFNDYFEAAVIRMLLQTKYSRMTDTIFDSNERAAKPNGRRKVLPDVACVVVDFKKGKGLRLYRDSSFVDAKYGRSKVYVSSYSYEAVGYADVLSKSPAANANVLPLMLYVTTADTPIYQNCVDEFTRKKY